MNNNKKPYDYLVVGAGLFGGVFAREASDRGKKVLIVDKRPQIGGNCASKTEDNIDVHLYGAHIFHTDDENVVNYLGRFTRFNNFINSPIADYNGNLYNMPFNLNTFYALFKTKTPREAAERLEKERAEYGGITEPKNLEEKALKLVGKTVYETLVKGYTEKQWGKKASELPAFIISRLPFRLTFDNNYFTDRYQGIPEDGYNAMFENLLKGIDVKLDTDFFKEKDTLSELSDKTVFTGRIDEYFGFSFGRLEYRSLRFETEKLDEENRQGVAVVNYTDAVTPYTRTIEHKHFRPGAKSPVTFVTKEYPAPFTEGAEPYYVINDEKNNSLYLRYKELADRERAAHGVIFGGRLAEYRYYDMDDVVLSALNTAKKEFG
jgi:UDP-galactopyranose mutase